MPGQLRWMARAKTSATFSGGGGGGGRQARVGAEPMKLERSCTARLLLAASGCISANAAQLGKVRETPLRSPKNARDNAFLSEKVV